MDLWIRSQDRENLVLTKGFELQNPSYNGGCQIFAVWQNNYQCVGNYKSKERALEVLDEIQEILKPKKLIMTFDNTCKIENLNYIVNPKYESIEEISTYVYEMPKE